MQVRAGKYNPTVSVFMTPKTRMNIEHGVCQRSTTPNTTDLYNPAIVQQAVIAQSKAGDCFACANGCLFLAHVARFDSVDWNKFKEVSHDTVHRKTPLSNVFGATLLNEIEAVFEARAFGWHKKLTNAQISRLEVFRATVTGVKVKFAKRDTLMAALPPRLSQALQTKLLIAMMEKLIDNDGKKLIL
jgi:hypothetical protein